MTFTLVTNQTFCNKTTLAEVSHGLRETKQFLHRSQIEGFVTKQLSISNFKRHFLPVHRISIDFEISGE